MAQLCFFLCFRINVPASEGYIRHYRSCRPKVGWHVQIHIDCNDPSQRATNSSTAEWSMNILDNVERVRKRIFNSVANDQS